MSEQNLKSLSMQNFKCFKDLNLEFGRLTVLSGHNGTGKSSAYQPLLLLSQVLNDSVSKPADLGKYWPLNGNMVRLGTASDVINDNQDKETHIKFDFEFSKNQNVSCSLKVETGKHTLVSTNSNLKSGNSLDFISNLRYISALRGSDESVYPSPDKSDYAKMGVGKDGRHASFLYDRMFNERNEFCSEVDDWLSSIANGMKAVVVPISNKKYFELKFEDSDSSAERIPANVGYGLSYAFPIIVETLASKKGDIIIIDSPEAHLHPKAQSDMGQKLAQVATEREIQIIVETHSDHVLNGIRLAVKEEKLKPEDLSILFFSNVENEAERISRPLIDRNGSLSEWPEGFFDQTLIDNIQLTGVT